MTEFSIEHFSVDIIGSDYIGIVIFPIFLFFMGLGVRECFEPAPRRSLILWAQFTEALILPCTLIALSTGMPGLIQWALTRGEYDRAMVLTGQTLGTLLPGAIYLTAGYIVVRMFGYCKQTKPLPWKLTIGLFGNIFGFGIMYLTTSNFSLESLAGFDPLHLLFTPFSLAVGFGVRQLKKPSYAWDGKRISQIKRKPVSLLLSDLSMINTMVYVLLALSYWLMGASENATQFGGVINMGFVGLFIGSVLYIVAYIVSMSETPPSTIEVRTKNWHFLEIFTVFFFFLFAPESLAGVASRIKSTIQTNALLSEMRGNFGGTVIRIDGLSVEELGEFNGRLCVKASNKGQHPATNLSIQLARTDSLSCDDPNDQLEIWMQLAVVDTLDIGETRSTCGNYTITTEKNDLTKFQQECGESNVNSYNDLFSAIGFLEYTFSYTEDSEHRDDSSGRCEVVRVY